MDEDTTPEWLEEKDVLSVVKNLLRYCAILPGKTKKEILHRKIVRNLVLILVSTSVIGAFIEAYHARSNFMVFIECGTTCISTSKSLFKMWYATFKEKELRYILDMMPRNFFVKDNVYKERILSTMKAKKKFTSILAISYTSLFIFAILAIGFEKRSSFFYRPPQQSSLVNDTVSETPQFIRRLPLRIWLPLNEQETPLYEIGFFYQIIVFSIQIYGTCVIDTSISVFVIFVSVQFELLATTIENAKQNVTELLEESKSRESKNRKEDSEKRGTPLKINASKKTKEVKSGIGQDLSELAILSSHFNESILSDDITDHNEASHSKDSEWRREMDNYLRLCAKRHQALLEYVDKLNIISSPIELLQALTSSILICTLGFTALVSGNPAILPKIILYTVCAFIQIGVPCFCATQLQTQSMRVAEAAYNSIWYDEPVSFQKSIAMIMMRAQQPAVLLVGPFGTMSLELFAGVAQSAYSYLTLLRQVYE